MSTTKHTAEPWYQCDTMAGVVYAGDADCRRAFHSDIVVDAGSTPEEQANAARIVQCVNACAPDSRLIALLRRLASKAIDSGATASERVDAHDAAEILRALGG